MPLLQGPRNKMQKPLYYYYQKVANFVFIWTNNNYILLCLTQTNMYLNMIPKKKNYFLCLKKCIGFFLKKVQTNK